LPITPKYAEAAEAPPAREEEVILGSGRSRILHKGFIGRCKELHALRRDLKQGKTIHVVQGLGGLGKSAFCLEALKFYKRQGREALTLWCAEVEDEPDPVSSLLRQFSASAEQLIGTDWDPIVAAVDRAIADTPVLQRPARRFVVLLNALLHREGLPPLVLHLDNLESLLSGTDNDDPAAFGTWRDAETDAWWQELTRYTQRSGGRLALLCSCRYRHPDFQSWLLPFGRLLDEAVWRLLGWFEGIRRLSYLSRAHLVERIAGHPRAVEFLDRLIRTAIADWEEINGDLPRATTEAEAKKEWDTLVVPVLPPLEQRLAEDLLFDALWTRVLDEPARRLLVRATVLRRPADWDLLRALAAPEGGNADRTIRRLRDASLLTEIRERRADGQSALFFEIHPSVSHLARKHVSNAAELCAQGHRLAGECLEHRAKTSRDWSDDYEASYHLSESGEWDRAFDLLLGPAEWLYGRGRISDSLLTLALLRKPENLHLQNQGRLSTLLGQGWVGLGNLSQATTFLHKAVNAFTELAAQDPSNAEWQRDLSISYNKIGDVLSAQGKLEEAITAYRDSLGIAKRLAAQDPSNAQWQHDLSISYERIGDVLSAQGKLEEAVTAYRDSLDIRQRLAAQDPSNAQWQRDLSVSYNKIGDVLRAQGKLEEAVTAYRDSLGIAKRLATQDPSNAQWQTDLVVSYWKLAQILGGLAETNAEARALLEQGLAILYRLRDEARLNVEQEQWIELFEHALEGSPQANP
jgi:tetratricopeptide (TPR) repeat protein